MDASRAGVPRTAPATWLVPTLALAAFVNTMGSLALGPFLPFVADELETSVALLGQVTALTMLLAALLGLVVGPLADHHGYRRTLTVGLLAVAISGLGTGLAPGFLLLLLAALIGAIGRAAVMPTAQAITGARFTDETVRRRAISWISTGHTCSPLLGIPLLTTIAAVTDWRVAFFVAGGLALAMMPVVWRMLGADETRPGASPRLATALTAYAPLWHHPPSLTLIGQIFVGSIGTWATFTYLGAYLTQQHGFTPPQVGGGYLAIGIGTMLGAKLVGTRLGTRLWPLLFVSRVVGGLLLGAALLLPVPVLAAIGLLLLGAMAHTANTAATVVLLVGESPAGRATTLTFNNSALSLGIAVGGALGGATLAVGGYPAVGLVSLAWLFGSAWMIWRSWPHPAVVSIGRSVEQTS